MGYLDTLFYTRFFFIVVGFCCTVAATGLAGRALVELADDKKFLANTIPGGTVHAQDVIVVSSLLCAACGLGVVVALYSEFHLHRERKVGHAPWISRLFNEVLLGVVCAFILGVAIAATVIVTGRSAHLSGGGLPESTLDELAKSLHKNIKYRNAKVFPSMILAWIAFGCFFITTILVILAGLHYRKVAKETAAAAREAHVGTETDKVAKPEHA